MTLIIYVLYDIYTKYLCCNDKEIDIEAEIKKEFANLIKMIDKKSKVNKEEKNEKDTEQKNEKVSDPKDEEKEKSTALQLSTIYDLLRNNGKCPYCKINFKSKLGTHIRCCSKNPRDEKNQN